MSGGSSTQSLSSDTLRVVDIEQSPGRAVILFLVGVVMTALSATVFWFPADEFPEGLQRLFGVVGVVFFGLCTSILLWRLVTVRGPVVTIAPEGLRDRRIAAEFIPWDAVESVTTWSLQGQRIIVIAVKPEVERRLTLTALARWTRRPNRVLGADGLCMTAQGLKVDHDALLATIEAYRSA